MVWLKEFEGMICRYVLGGVVVVVVIIVIFGGLVFVLSMFCNFLFFLILFVF